MKTYTEQEIDNLVKEVQDQLVSPLLKAAQEELAKSEAGKRMESPKEGGNGTEPKAGEAKSDAGNGPRYDAYKVEAQPAKGPDSRYDAYKAPGKSGKGSPSNPVAKGEQEMKKDDGPPPESSPEGSAGGGAPEASGGGDAPPASDASPAPDAAPDAAPAPDASAAPQGDPDQMGMDGQVPDMQVLVQAYQQLMQQSPESFQAHVAAMKQVMMGSMAGAQQSSPMDAGSAPAAMPPADAGSAGGMPPPAMKAAAPMAAAPAPAPQPPQPMAMSEKEAKLEELTKSQDEKIQALEKQMSGLLGLVEQMVTQPKRKAVTSLQEFQYIAKSEGDVPAAKKLTKSEVRTRLEQAAKKSDLKKSDQDLITRYFLQGDVKVEDLEHLLK